MEGRLRQLLDDKFSLIPPEIRERIEREEYVDAQARAGRAMDQAIRALDSDLSLVFVRPRVPEEELPSASMILGRWHVKRNNGPVPPTYIPITTPDGGYREPDAGILTELAKRDLRRRGALEDALRPRKRDLGVTDEQRHDNMRHDFEAAKRVAGEGGLYGRKWGRG